MPSPNNIQCSLLVSVYPKRGKAESWQCMVDDKHWKCYFPSSFSFLIDWNFPISWNMQLWLPVILSLYWCLWFFLFLEERRRFTIMVCTLPHPPPLPCFSVHWDLELRKKVRRDQIFSLQYMQEILSVSLKRREELLRAQLKSSRFYYPFSNPTPFPRLVGVCFAEQSYGPGSWCAPRCSASSTTCICIAEVPQEQARMGPHCTSS